MVKKETEPAGKRPENETAAGRAENPAENAGKNPAQNPESRPQKHPAGRTGILLLNGEPWRGPIDDGNAYVLCADGAYNWAKGRVRIDENLGDFDSASEPPVPAPSRIYPSQKDFTDGEIALERLLELFRRREIVRTEIYGGGGGREDHFLGNLHLLYRACREGLPCTMFTAHAALSVRRGKFTLEKVLGKTVSLLPFGGDAHILYSRGLFYPTENLTLVYGSCRGVSNVGVSENAEIDCDGGFLLVAVNKEKDVKNHLFEAAEGHPSHSAPV